MSTPVSLSPASLRVTPNLRNAFGGVWRLTVARLFTKGHVFAFVVLLALLAAIALAMLYSRAGVNAYLGWTIDFYFTFLVPVVAFITAAGAIRDDMKPSTLDYLLTRPIPRPAYLGFKYVSHVAGAQVEFAVAAILLVVLGQWFDVKPMLGAVPSLLAAQFMLVIAFSAMGFMAGVLTTRYVVLGLAYGAIVEVGVGQIPTQLSRLSMTHQVKALLLPLDPAFVAKTAATAATAADLSTTYSMLLAFSAVALGVAAVVFLVREHAGAIDS